MTVVDPRKEREYQRQLARERALLNDPARRAAMAAETTAADELNMLILAAELLIVSANGTWQMLHRKMRIPQGHAQRIMQILERHGVVGPEVVGQRRVLVDRKDLDATLDRLRVATQDGWVATGIAPATPAPPQAQTGGDQGGVSLVKAAPPTPTASGEPGGDEGGEKQETAGHHLWQTGGDQSATTLAKRESATVSTTPAATLDDEDDAGGDGGDGGERPRQLLVGRIIEGGVQVVTTLHQSDSPPVRATRATIRYGWVVGQGIGSWSKRGFRAATQGNNREQVAMARRSQLPDEMERKDTLLDKLRNSRIKRLKDLPHAIKGIAIGITAAAAVIPGALLILGILSAIATHGFGGNYSTGWNWWWWFIGWVGLIVATLLPLSAALAISLIPVIVVRAAHAEGQKVTTPPKWLLTRDELHSIHAEVTLDSITAAMAHMKIQALTKALKDGGMLEFIVQPREQGGGTYFQLRLPVGCIAADFLPSAKVELLAGNLARHKHEVWPQRQADSDARVLDCWVADKGTMDRPAPEWPLLHDGEFDVFRDRAPLGVTMRRDPVMVAMLQKHWLVGANSKQGKTTLLRLALLCLALDPTVELRLADLKGDGDLRCLRNRCHTYIEGSTDEDAEAACIMLESVLAEMKRRYAKKAELNLTGPITRAMSRRKGSGFHPIWAVVDECFPAGTKVGGRNIEDLRPGDWVPSWDENTGEPCDRRVVATMTNNPNALVRVYFSNGDSLVCTPNHPLWTHGGWVAAGSLNPTTSEVLQYGDARPAGLGSLLGMPDLSQADARPEGVPQAARASGVLARVSAGGSDIAGPHVDTRSKARRESSVSSLAAGAEPHVGPCHQGEDVRHAQINPASTTRAGGQRTRTYRAAAAACRRARAWMGDRVRCADTGGQDAGRTADALQAGHREPGLDDRGRSRRLVSQRVSAASSGPAERRVPQWSRVDRVEVLEPGSDGRYSGVCPDGLVYNIEVEDTHVYRVGAGGFVAHNCQVMYMMGKSADGESIIGGSKDESRAQAAAKRLHDQARAVNIHLIQATQRPDPQTMPVRVREGVHVRVCLWVPKLSAAQMILAEAADQGARPYDLRPGIDAGTAVFAGEVEDIPVGQAFTIVKSYHVGPDDAEKVAQRAIEAWTKYGQPSPMVIDGGEDPAAPDTLGHIREAMRGEDKVLTRDVQARLKEDRPDVYGDWSDRDLADALKEYELYGVRIRKSNGDSKVFLEDIERAIRERPDDLP